MHLFNKHSSCLTILAQMKYLITIFICLFYFKTSCMFSQAIGVDMLRKLLTDPIGFDDSKELPLAHRLDEGDCFPQFGTFRFVQKRVELKPRLFLKRTHTVSNDIKLCST